MKNYVKKIISGALAVGLTGTPVGLANAAGHETDRDQTAWNNACGEDSTAYKFAAGDVAWNHMATALTAQYGRDATNREISAGLEAATTYTIARLEGILGTDQATVWDDGRIERLGREWNSMGYMQDDVWVDRTNLGYVDPEGHLPTGRDGIRSDYMWVGDAICIDDKLSELLAKPGVEAGLIERIITRRDDGIAELTPEAVQSYLMDGINMVQGTMGGFGSGQAPEQLGGMYMELDARVAFPMGEDGVVALSTDNEFGVARFKPISGGTEFYNGLHRASIAGNNGQVRIGGGVSAETGTSHMNYDNVLEAVADHIAAGGHLWINAGRNDGPVLLDLTVDAVGGSAGQRTTSPTNTSARNPYFGLTGDVELDIRLAENARLTSETRARLRSTADNYAGIQTERTTFDLSERLGLDFAPGNGRAWVGPGVWVRKTDTGATAVGGSIRFTGRK
jgi:hypothetical protein